MVPSRSSCATFLSQSLGPELMDGVDLLEDMESAAIRCQKVVDELIRFSTQARCSFSQMDINQVLKDTLEITGEQYSEAGPSTSPRSW